MNKIKHKTLSIYWKKGDGIKWNCYCLNTGKLLYRNDESDGNMLTKMINGEVVLMTEDEPKEKDITSRWYAGYLNNMLIIKNHYSNFWIGDDNYSGYDIQPCSTELSGCKQITSIEQVQRLENAFKEFKKVVKEVAQKEKLGG